MLVTGTELARPYLLKLAIDDHITGYSEPMYLFDKEDAPMEGIVFNDKVFIRRDKLDTQQIQSYSSKDIKTLTKIGGDFYLLDGDVSLTESKELSAVKSGDKYIVSSESSTFDGVKLTDSEYKLFREADIKGLSRIGLTLLTIIILGFLFSYIQVYILNYVSQKIIFNIRQEVFTHLQKMSLSYFDKNPVGRLVTRVTNDTEALNEMYTSVLVYLFKDVFLITGIVIVMIKMNYRLALLSFTVVPLILIASVIFRAKIRNVYREVRVRLARINATLNENITGMKTIHIFKQEDKKFREFDTAIGIPAVVMVIRVISTGKTIWKRPIPSGPMSLDSMILYANPIIRIIKFMMAKISAPYINPDLFKISPPLLLYRYSYIHVLIH